MDKQVLIIAGPTASGKSQAAVDVAMRCNGVVINADAQQVYCGLPILAAAPSAKDKDLVEHRMYEIWEPEFNGSVVNWLEEAVKTIEEVWKENKLPVVVGGTGLYIDNLLNGTTPIPETSPQIRAEVMKQMAESSSAELHKKLAEFDAETAARLEPNDQTRVRRAYEVWLDTGIKMSEWHCRPRVQKLPRARFLTLRIMPPQTELDQRCYQRFDAMLAQGAIEEVQQMKQKKIDPMLPAMRTIGYRELSDYLDGKFSLQQATEFAKLRSRQYAKRQRTWFGNKLNAEAVLETCYKGDIEQLSKMLGL